MSQSHEGNFVVEVNPALFQEQAPADGVCAILAHELVHIVSLSRRVGRAQQPNEIKTANAIGPLVCWRKHVPVSLHEIESGRR
jgi:hypothetical protein